MAIKFVLLVNKQGQTRLAKYSDLSLSMEERRWGQSAAIQQPVYAQAH